MSSGAARDDLRRDLESIQLDLTSLKADLAATMEDLVAAGKAEGAEARAKIEAAIRERIDKLNSAARNLGDRGEEVAGNVRKRIEDKPFESVAVAFGVGLLVGAILRR